MIYDIIQEAIEKALKSIALSVSKFIEKEKLAEKKQTIVNRISIREKLLGTVDTDLVPEMPNGEKKNHYQALTDFIAPS